MNKLTTQEQHIFQQLAACGKYYNTGKVLIGVAYVPTPQAPTREGEIIQDALLKHPRNL